LAGAPAKTSLRMTRTAVKCKKDVRRNLPVSPAEKKRACAHFPEKERRVRKIQKNEEPEKIQKKFP
jgi:hypothetical protein